MSELTRQRLTMRVALRGTMLAGALALLVTPVAVVQASEHEAAKAQHHEAAKAEHKPEAKGDAKPGDKKPDAKPEEGKAAAEKKAEAKPAAEAKPGEAKTPAAKGPDSKPADGKTAAESQGKAGEGKQAAAEPQDEGAEKAEKKVRPKKKKVAAAKEPPPVPGEGPSPASPPPLNMAGLRDEARRENGAKKIDPGASPRTKVEQMLSEIGKTREALHGETIKLEALLATEPAEGGGAGAAGGATGPGGKPAKNPLDILAKALRGIKPEAAAPIVSRLDKRLAATVLQRMPPVDAGKIMGAMKPDTAAELATQIALRSPEVKK